MKDLRKEYIKTKCVACESQSLGIKEDRCNISVFQYNGYLYCKCSNCSNENKEIKRKLI